MSYYTKITKAGLAAITAAMNNNSKVPITYMAFGDGNGYIPEPNENADSLINEVYRVGVNKVEVHAKNPNWLVCEAIIPSAVGGFNIREVALFDNSGKKMLAVASYPPTYKPTVEEGAAKIQTIRIVVQVENTGNFELIIDPDIVLATVEYVNNQIKKSNFKSIEELLAFKNPQHGMKADVISYHENMGLGGGSFIYDSNRSNHNDGGVCLNGWVRQLENNVLNPFMFGAYGDFIPNASEVISRKSGHDDSDAFQKMYNMNKYTVFTNISKLPPQNMAEYTFEWGNQMFYLEDTLPVRSYQFTDCKGGKIFFNPIGNKDLFTTPRQEMREAYSKNTGWNTQTISFVTFKDGMIVGNVGRTSIVHAQKCFDGANAYKWVLDNMLIERFANGVSLYPLDTSEWTGDRIGNFYENELRNVAIHECIQGLYNAANSTHASNLTIGGGYVVGHQFQNKFEHMLINIGAGFSCTGFNIAPANRQGVKALVFDACLGSSYSGGYTEWFDTFFELSMQHRFGGFSFIGSHIFKEYRDLLVQVSDNTFSKFSYDNYTRTYKAKSVNNQFLNSTGIIIGGKTELLGNFFRYTPQYDFKYGLYGVQVDSGLSIDVKRFESVWTGFTSKYGIRVLNFTTNRKAMKFSIENKFPNAQVFVLYRNIKGFSSDNIKLNVLEFDGTNDRISVGEDVIDYGNGWKLAVVKNINEVVSTGELIIDIHENVQVEIEHIGAYSADGIPFFPTYVNYKPKINSYSDRFVSNKICGGMLDTHDITQPFSVIENGALSDLSWKTKICTANGGLNPDITFTTDVSINTSTPNQILLETLKDSTLSNIGVGSVLNIQHASTQGVYQIVRRSYSLTTKSFSRNLTVKPMSNAPAINSGTGLVYANNNLKPATYEQL